ncbi:uncharacterized protein LOC121248491 [Juglans microcarpa x Juglans regia]|uniref:uncharacterized protein LOC121248491 n=1 Tax=Juglans microcarpa x Juglans regia TaxID=2249226 RepID=UPI001B7ECBCD|nr:uncharacterized protein LOC121248491 [Juglans microcarpa x Juglans regia]
MGHFRHPYIQAAKTFSHFCNSNKTIRFLLSFSLLSVILSHSSLLPFLLESFHVHVSPFPLKPFSYTIDKNYVFLLCNGLLVFIVKNSGLVGNNSSLWHDLDEEFVLKNGDSRPSEQELGLSENKASDGSKNALPEVEEEEERANGTLIALGEGENGLILAMHDEDEEQDNGLVIIKEEEEEEGNGLELLSTEELNKIFDDFIRKKKEEIKFGGQQLIVV